MLFYHQAAQAGSKSQLQGSGFRAYTERNNATPVLLSAAKERKHLKRLVFASTSSVYDAGELYQPGLVRRNRFLARDTKLA